MSGEEVVLNHFSEPVNKSDLSPKPKDLSVITILSPKCPQQVVRAIPPKYGAKHSNTPRSNNTGAKAKTHQASSVKPAGFSGVKHKRSSRPDRHI